MKVSWRNGRVAIDMAADEALRLATVLTEATAGLSRAEFYIRTGCAVADVEAVVETLTHSARESEGAGEASLPAGDERVENPPKPR